MVLTASLGSTLPQWMVQCRVEKMVYLKKWANDPKIAIADKLFFFSTPLYVFMRICISRLPILQVAKSIDSTIPNLGWVETHHV